MKKPQRPTSVPTALGPAEVVYVDQIKSESGKVLNALGYVHYNTRRIQILNGLHPSQEAHTLRHEWMHLVLWDAGAVNALSRKKQELVCDVVATALLMWPVP
jgi:Zn-dependent peptidase ImmA (M78 family)